MAGYTTGQAGGQVQQLANVPAAYEGDALEMARAQRLAQMLGSQQMPEGQMISGRYVKPSWTQQLAGLVNAGTGAYYANQAEKQNVELAKKIREGETSALADYMTTKQGRPAIAGTPNIPTETYETVKGTPAQTAIPANPQAAYANLYADPRASNRLRDMAFTKMMADPEAFTLSEGAVRYKEMPDGTIKQVAAGGEKLHTVKGNLVTSGGKTIYSAPLTGEEKANPAEAPLRTSFLNQATPHIQISQAYRKIETAPDTAAGDMSKIFGFMKILDPSSTVREGEYASAENARGVPDTVRAQYNKVMSGQRLTPAQRTQFSQAAGDLVQSQKQQFEGQKKFFENIALKNKIAPESVIYDPYEGMNLQTTPPKLPKTPTNVGQQFGVPQVNAGGWNIISVTPTK